jgi:acetyltransferase
VEVMVGAIRDPEFGPVVMAGLGGVLVEVRRDIQLAMAPVDEAQATGLLTSLRGAAIFGGVRGAPAVDLRPLATVITSVGHLITDIPQIRELDLNPVLACADGCVVVDWRILAG